MFDRFGNGYLRRERNPVSDAAVSEPVIYDYVREI
jgi:hypothetical protein